jgi:hypothetical protein
MIALPKTEADKLESEVQQLLAATSLKAFHGKEYARRFESKYRAVFVALRDALGSGVASFAACTLLDESWKKEYLTFVGKVIPNALDDARASGDEAVAALTRLAAPLFTFQRIANEVLLEGGTAAIDVDADGSTRDIANYSFQARGHTIAAGKLIRPIYQASRASRFPCAPSLDYDALRVCPDEESALLQVADLLGNFAAAYVAFRLGRTSKTLTAKASIFEDVFGDLVKGADFSGAELAGGDDLRLKAAGAFTLKLPSI